MGFVLAWVVLLAVQTAGRDVDGEGRIAAVDRCPDEPEDFDGYQDDDGCPDRDNDGDGILDAVRLVDGVWINHDCIIENGVHRDCRDLAEDRDGDLDEDGCPEIVCTMPACAWAFAEFVNYDAQGRLGRATDEQFARVVRGLQSYPEVRVSIDVFTDNSRGAARAERMNARVAATFVKALVRRGVARERLVVEEYDLSRPYVTDPTPEDRAMYRYVELMPICEAPDTGPPVMPAGRRCGS